MSQGYKETPSPIKVCLYALKNGISDKTAKEIKATKGWMSQAVAKYKFSVLMDHEIYDDNGKERNFRELRRVFNNWQRV